jgi:hypothetical protein
MKVYVVWFGDYSRVVNCAVGEVFSDRERAEQRKAEIEATDLACPWVEIEERDLL